MRMNGDWLDFRSVGLALLALTLTGCIGFRTNTLDTSDYAPAPKGVGELPQVTFEHAIWRARLEDGKIVERLPTHFLSKEHRLATRFVGGELWQSRNFKAVRPVDGGGDLHIDFRYTSAPEGIGVWGTISRLLLHTLPSWSSTEIELVADVRRGTEKIASYTLSETLTDFRWLPAIVLTPFMSPTYKQNTIHLDLYRTVIQRMREEAIIGR